MAVAIFLVVLYHAPISINNRLISNIKMFGYGGVDIFLFASGLGCFYSFMKDENILEFLKRRLKKLMPTYWCFIVIWLVLKIYRKGMPFHSIIGNILGIENFTCSGNDFNWYISAIWLFYLLTPILAKIVEKIKSKIQLIWIILFLVLVSIPFWNSKILIITMSRLPIFFLGMYCAKVWKEKEIIFKKKIVYLVSLSIIGYVILNLFNKYMPTKMWNYALYWYPFILITPGLCIAISLISKCFAKFEIGKKALKVVEIIGNNTFEIFLIHILIFGMYNVYNFSSKLILLLLLIPATIIFKYYCKFMQLLCHKVRVILREKIV